MSMVGIQIQSIKGLLEKKLKTFSIAIFGADIAETLQSSNICLVTNKFTLDQMVQEVSSVLVQLLQDNTSPKEILQSVTAMVHPSIRYPLRQSMKELLPSLQEVGLQNRLCYCQEPINSSRLVSTCLSCDRVMHNKCMFYPGSVNSQCPECFIKSMDPFSGVEKVLAVRLILLRDKSTQVEVDLSNVKGDSSVELRCVKIDSDPFYNSQISWPDTCTIKINGGILEQLTPLPINSAFKRREDNVYVVPPSELRKKTLIEVFQRKQYCEKKFLKTKNCMHVLAVLVVRPVSVEEINKRALSQMINDKVYQCLVVERYKNKNSAIEMQSQRINLVCPFSKDRMRIPARGANCCHLQCFDLTNFLQMNKATRQFKCPISRCLERCHRVSIDPVVYRILREDSQQTVEGVEFSISGHRCLSKAKERVITIDSDSEGEEASKSPGQKSPKLSSLSKTTVTESMAFEKPHRDTLSGVEFRNNRLQPPTRESSGPFVFQVKDSDSEDDLEKWGRRVEQEKHELKQLETEGCTSRLTPVGSLHHEIISSLRLRFSMRS